MSLKEFQELVLKEEKIVKEMNFFLNNSKKEHNPEEKKLLQTHISSLKNSLKKTSKEASDILNGIILPRKLAPIKHETKQNTKKEEVIKKPQSLKISGSEKRALRKKLKISPLEKVVLKRLKKKEEKIIKKKSRKPSSYVKISNRFFSKFSDSLADKKIFSTLRRDLIQANMQFIPSAYISVILFTIVLSIIASFILFVFFLFFSFGGKFLIIRTVESAGARFFKIFWILLAIPLFTFLFMYFYPSMEKKSIENKINQELPFATIHMASISGSMLDPSKIFSIIISTEEYPFLSKEFTKLINEINIYGYDLVNALRKVAFDSPSKKLSELLTGLATTITSGGDLPSFFEKRSQTLLFEHKLEREKHAKSAEIFMDIYISVVIAAPMILMLLLMMMKMSGFGISLSTSTITLIMVLGVSIINIVFLSYLYLKQTRE